ncbi:Tyrosine-protein kinase Fps85D [Strongyloides ratti]|uniref:Tyrosine-protein kinase n=1 Tax=Strongyloides ratti TaxID=34506 RepID=A0A090LDN0_STRRB|nr:Tyrosine-protein kinase Fps85D [Strongyloides ratti]CEF67872.1 Tyrosine-protein kinase Fps85D [Strongyloides ratti]
MSKMNSFDSVFNTIKNRNNSKLIRTLSTKNDDCIDISLVVNELSEYSWYHGLYPRDEISELLEKDGDFAVRSSEVDGQRHVICTVLYGTVKHIKIRYSEKQWFFKTSLKMNQIKTLLDTYIESQKPIMSDGTVIKRYISRFPLFILHEHVVRNKQIGKGNFGEVFSGTFKTVNGENRICAIKTLKTGGITKIHRALFFKEAKIMKTFDHPNCINLYGIAAMNEPVMIIMEFAENGGMLEWLKENKNCETKILYKFSYNIACGLEYLHSKNIIHRDIAARNCLLGKHNVAKISDFGLSVINESKVKLNKKMNIPLRHIPPEAIRQEEYTKESDVWAYGVTVWEIMNRCSVLPYNGLTFPQIMKAILSGTRHLEVNDESPAIVKSIFVKCLEQKPCDRITFGEIVQSMKNDFNSD